MAMSPGRTDRPPGHRPRPPLHPTRFSRRNPTWHAAAGRSNRPPAAAIARSAEWRFVPWAARLHFSAAASPSLFRFGCPEKLDRRRGSDLLAKRRQRLVPLALLAVAAQLVAEQGIYEFQHGRLTTKIQRQRQPASGRNLLAKPLEHARIGAAKTIDRLLVVADQEQFSPGDLAVAEARSSSTCKGSVS